VGEIVCPARRVGVAEGVAVGVGETAGGVTVGVGVGGGSVGVGVMIATKVGSGLSKADRSLWTGRKVSSVMRLRPV
jgi:hypothetical protein